MHNPLPPPQRLRFSNHPTGHLCRQREGLYGFRLTDRNVTSRSNLHTVLGSKCAKVLCTYCCMSRHGRLSVTFINRVAANIGCPRPRSSTTCANNSVKAVLLRAKDTSMRCMPCSGFLTSGTYVVIKQ